MQTSQIKHHTEDTIVKAIHRLVSQSSTCRVTVAFCGEAVHLFFPEKPSARPEDLRIMIDASERAVRRGLTNPKGLERLLGLTDEVRSLDGLHAKVWVFDGDKALVGSTNMSKPSIKQQVQLTLEICDSRASKRLVGWFDTLWNGADQVDQGMVRKLMPLWPKHKVNGSGRKTHAKLPPWRGKAPQPPLSPSEFKVGLKKAEIKKLLSQFRKNKCEYDKRMSCSEEAAAAEKDRDQWSQKLRSLMRRRSSWRKRNLVELFNLAYPYGKNSIRNRPRFIRQSPSKVARSLGYLLSGAGDPYVRLEKVLDSGSRYKLNGMKKAGLTFLMHLWSPAEFAFVMGPLDKAFKRLKITFDRTKSNREGMRYKNEIAAVKHVGKLTGLKSLIQTDRFLNAVAEAHIGNWRTS